MDLAFVKPAYSGTGPVSTVVIPTGKHTESGARELTLTWRALAGELKEAGIAEADLAALERELTDLAPGDTPETVLLVAAGGRLVLRQELPEPPSRPEAVHGPQPHLTELVRQGSRRVPHIVVVADRLGGAIRVFGQFDEELASRSVSGENLHINKVKVGGWTHLRFLHRIENTWEHNASLVARDVNSLAGVVAPQVVLLAGDVRARTLVHEALDPATKALVRIIEHPGESEPTEEILGSLVRDTARDHVRELRGRVDQELGRRGAAVAGLAETAFALRRAQVQALLLDMAFLADPPRLPAEDAGLPVTGQLPADDVFLAAAVATGADLVVSDEPTGLADGCGALLRYADESTP